MSFIKVGFTVFYSVLLFVSLSNLVGPCPRQGLTLFPQFCNPPVSVSGVAGLLAYTTMLATPILFHIRSVVGTGGPRQ